MYIDGHSRVFAEMVMEITVAEIGAHNLQDANKCHEPFTVDSALVLSAENSTIRHSVVSVSPYEKRYPPNEVDYAAYINNPDQTVFFGYSGEKLAGELVIRRWWNNFAYIEDLTVKATFKRQGVGRALMDRAIRWAKGRRLPGIMLETQNNNVAACRFYERCGFELGGFDRQLYRALNPDSHEIALYWYLLFQTDSSL
jgi:ribosomal protein S18 acetylase RimI-like enzyme